ncbi:MAG: cytochrome-c peroxidase [Candidatus Thiodiazotropha sp.]
MYRFTALTIACCLSVGTALAGSWQALPKSAPEPADNPTTPEKVELGKMLFFDPRLSSNGTVSCFSCHNVMEGGDDHRSTSIGVHGQAGGRNAPTVWNAAYHSVQFWDGRAASLEDQAKGPPANPIEMGMSNLDAVADRIQKIPGYRPYFDRAFGAGDNISIDTIAKAIAAYERTLITPDSPYDRYARGDAKALDEQQLRGMQTFADVGCTACHSGANFDGPQLKVGQGFYQKFPTFTDNEYVTRYGLMDDTGRMSSTGNEADKNLWRVPTLRNLAYTAPYMHTGSVKTLPEAVRVMSRTQLGKSLDDNQVEDIVAFLGTLNGEFPEQVMPRLPATPGDLIE